MEKKRCRWVEGAQEIYVQYHDEEWGVEVHEDALLFEMLILESFHTGLSWLIILKKRQAFRQAFDQFDPTKMSQYNQQKVEELLQNAEIVRHRGKILAAIRNATCFLTIQREFGSFNQYLWNFVQGKKLVIKGEEAATANLLSDTLAKDMKRRGFKFLGSVTINSYLQAVGVIDAHDSTCWKAYIQ